MCLRDRGAIWLCPEEDMAAFRNKVGDSPLIDPT
jgi:hypothetical protein